MQKERVPVNIVVRDNKQEKNSQMTDESVLISITISVSEREIKFEKETKIEDMEEAIQGIMLEAGQLTFGMGIKECDNRIAKEVPMSWQNVGTEE